MQGKGKKRDILMSNQRGAKGSPFLDDNTYKKGVAEGLLLFTSYGGIKTKPISHSGEQNILARTYSQERTPE